MGQIDGAQRAPVRVVYMSMMGSGRQVRLGVLATTSGPSAQVQFDDCNCPQWVPLARAQRAPAAPRRDREPAGRGWGQLMLWVEGGC